MGEGEIWPPATPKPLNRWSPKFVYVTTSGISTTTQNFIQIGLGVSVLRMRDFAPLGKKWLGYFFGSWERLQPWFAHRFWRKNTSNDAVPHKQVPFGGRETNISGIGPIFPKTAIFGPHFDGTIFSPENGFNIGPLESKRPFIVVVAQ